MYYVVFQNHEMIIDVKSMETLTEAIEFVNHQKCAGADDDVWTSAIFNDSGRIMEIR